MCALTFDQWLKLGAIIGGFGSFLWGVYQWRMKSLQDLDHEKAEAERVAANRTMEATKPFLDRQLAMYSEASRVAAVLASPDVNDDDRSKAMKEFWLLYYGELAMVESPDVAEAMDAIKETLEHNPTQQQLAQVSLNLTQACRLSLDQSWGIHAWKAHKRAKKLA